MHSKMASATNKRKQDEKHLKILREMVALSHNKQCFDCHQRGPTYVNMTIGSYACTSCSGLLRGLNPPHRVKSISMTTFTPDEMEFLKSRGNEFCRKVWLGRFNSQLHREPDSKDEHRAKEFMSDKYEKKKFYMEPTESLHEEARRMNTPLAKQNDKPLKTLGTTIPSLRISNTQSQVPKPVLAPPVPAASQPSIVVPQPAAPSQPQASQPSVQKSSTFDLLSDLGADPFSTGPQNAAAPAPAHNPTVAPVPSSGGFADFSSAFSHQVAAPVAQPAAQAAYPASSGVLQPFSTAPSSIGGVPAQPTATTAAPTSGLTPSDKYAALASLDNVFGGNQTVNWEFGGGGSVGGNVGAPPPGTNVNWGGAGGPPGAPPGANNMASAFGPASVPVEGSFWCSSYIDHQVASPTALHPSNPFLDFSSQQSIYDAANPFGGGGPAVPAASMANPFMAGGAAQASSASGFPPQSVAFATQFGTSPQSTVLSSSGFGQFGAQGGMMTVAGGAPGATLPPPGVQYTMQNGGFGAQTQMTTSAPGWPGTPAGYAAPPAGHPMQSTAQLQQAQYAKMGGAQQQVPGGFVMPTQAQVPQQQLPQQVPQQVPQPQQFAQWGAPQQPAGNPFMSAATTQVAAPRGGSTNPFL